MADNGGVPIMYETQALPTRVQSSVKCHPEYIRTLPGILKIVEIVSFFLLPQNYVLKVINFSISLHNCTFIAYALIYRSVYRLWIWSTLVRISQSVGLISSNARIPHQIACSRRASAHLHRIESSGLRRRFNLALFIIAAACLLQSRVSMRTVDDDSFFFFTVYRAP